MYIYNTETSRGYASLIHELPSYKNTIKYISSVPTARCHTENFSTFPRDENTKRVRICSTIFLTHHTLCFHLFQKEKYYVPGIQLMRLFSYFTIRVSRIQFFVLFSESSRQKVRSAPPILTECDRTAITLVRNGVAAAVSTSLRRFPFS